MSLSVRRAAGSPLTEEARDQLQALATMPDAEIDFSDIPERLPNKRPPSLPLEKHTLTLHIDSEVAAWLENSSVEAAGRINALLKREVQRIKRTQATEHELEVAS